MTCIAPGCRSAREVGAVFCAVHLKAPAGQRGGWLSAEKRRRARAASPEVALDASNIVRRLWVGSVPPFDRDLPEFDVLVLCAREIQPERIAFGKQVLRVPLPDATLTDGELATAMDGARSTARALREGRRVLVTCQAGLNRSALVAGLALRMITKLDGMDVIELMRTRRAPAALHNAAFAQYLIRFARG